MSQESSLFSLYQVLLHAWKENDFDLLDALSDRGIKRSMLENFLQKQQQEGGEDEAIDGVELWSKLSKFIYQHLSVTSPTTTAITNPVKASIAKLSTPVTIQEPKFDNLNGVGGFNEVQLGENIYLDRSDVDQLLHDNTEVFRLLHSSVIVKVIDLQRDSEGKVSKLGLETVDDISDDNDHSVVIRELKWVGDDLSSTSIDLRTENILPHLGDSYSLEEWRQIFQVETESGSKLSVTKVLLSESGVQMVKAGVSNVCLRDIGLCSMECISASHASENEEEDGQDNREESDFKIEAMLICSNNDLKEVYNKLKLATEIMKLQLLEIEDELEADNHQVVNEEAVGVVEVEQETTKAEAIHTEEVEINSTDEQVVVMDQEPCGNGIVEEHTTESQPSEEATITQQSQEKEEIDEERLLVQHSIPSMEIVHIDDQSQQSTYAEQTSQFSSSEIETEQTQSGKEIEDQCDSVEVRSETPTAIEEEEVTRMQASEEPDAVLARAHSESVDLHTSSLDNEQSEKPTHATTSISIENSSSIDENDLTLAQRRDLKAKKLQAEKQRKWQEYVAASSSSNKIESFLPPQPNQGPAGASKKKLQERYEQAKLLQSQQEEERLSKLKNDPNKRLSAGGFESTKSKWSTSESSSGKRQSLELNPSGATEVGRLERAHRKDSMRLKWQGVLHVSKESELDRFQNARNRTISQFQLLEASGLVKKRIGEWEELFMQIAATAEQLEEFIRSAQALSMKKQQQMQGNMEEMIERFKEDCLIPENFVINDTHIYSADVFEFHVRSYFKKSLNESKTNHVSLSCGVYGEQAAKPPIDVFAAIIKTSDGKTYVAVTVKAAAAKELDPNVYGLKKIVVVAKDIDTQLFEKLIYVLPMPGWEQYIEGFENCYDPLASSSNIGEAAAQQGQQEEGIHLECVSEDANNLTEAEGLQPTTTEEPVELEHVEIQTAADSSDSNPAVEVSEEVEKGNPTADFGEEDQTNGNIQEEEEKLEVVEGEEGGDENLIVVEEEKLVIVEEEEKKKAPKSVSIQDDAANTISYYEQVSELDQSVDGANQSTTHIDASYISMTSADEGEGTWQSNYTPCKPEGAVEDDSKTLPSPILLDDPHDDNFDDFLEDSRSNSKVLEDNSTRGGGRRPSNASGRLSVDDDDDDGEPDLDVEDDANEMYHFGRTQSVASVMMVRSYMPMPNGNVTGTKEAPMVFAWKVDDEKETDLDDIGHIHMILDINDVVNVSTTTNAFVIQGSQSAMVFTGTLKYASVQSHYIVDQGKVFEWIRGAAASGWLIKYPMKSQQMGRRTRRFFILRDNYLSYHKDRPTTEEDIEEHNSQNTLVITANSTVDVGRKFLTRCLIVSTPADTLWIRVRGDYAQEAVKWLTELNKSLQFLQRPKLFITKPRIESKWYHENPQFNIVFSDVSSVESKYVKAALFCLKPTPVAVAAPAPVTNSNNRDSFFVDNTPAPTKRDDNMYSVDIASSDVPRTQLEILTEEESPYMPAHLTSLKVYGDVVLLGGEQGFLGYGLISRAGTNDSSVARMTMATMEAGKSNTNTNSSRKVIFCIPFFAAPGTSTYSKVAATHNMTYNAELGCPHDADSVITTFDSAKTSSVFVVGDNKGKVSLWHMPRNKELCSLSPNSVINCHAIKRITKRLRPELVATLDLSSMDSTKPSDTTFAGGKNFDASVDSSERIIKLTFYCEDKYLVISTNRRLLLITMKSEEDSTGKFTMYDGLSRSRSDSIESVAAMAARVQHSKIITGFDGWIQIDRAMPGRKAVFSMYIGPEKKKKETDVRKIVQWKVLETDDDLEEAKVASWLKGNKKTVENVANKNRKCTVSRVEWTEEMFLAMFEKLKPCPVPSSDD